MSLSTLLMARDAAKVVGLSAFEWSLKANDSDPFKPLENRGVGSRANDAQGERGGCDAAHTSRSDAEADVQIVARALFICDARRRTKYAESRVHEKERDAKLTAEEGTVLFDLGR